jgi:asparagine N-glycosylation enzyme membrane subunit Stt3
MTLQVIGVLRHRSYLLYLCLALGIFLSVLRAIRERFPPTVKVTGLASVALLLMLALASVSEGSSVPGSIRLFAVAAVAFWALLSISETRRRKRKKLG